VAPPALADFRWWAGELPRYVPAARCPACGHEVHRGPCGAPHGLLRRLLGQDLCDCRFVESRAWIYEDALLALRAHVLELERDVLALVAALPINVRAEMDRRGLLSLVYSRKPHSLADLEGSLRPPGRSERRTGMRPEAPLP
jgi:hypothetical protein